MNNMVLTWRKSSRSMNQGGECVEVTRLPHAIGIRDSKNPHHGHLTITPNAFRTLTHRIKRDEAHA